MRKLKLLIILLLSITIINITNNDVIVTETKANNTFVFSTSLNIDSVSIAFEPILLEGNNEEIKDIEQLKEELEIYLEELKVFVDMVKVDSGKPVEELPLGHRYAPKGKIDILKDLIISADELLENEEATTEDLNEILTELQAAEIDLTDNIIIGTKESDYKNLIIIIGSALSALAVIGTVVILVLVKKRK